MAVSPQRYRAEVGEGGVAVPPRPNKLRPLTFAGQEDEGGNGSAGGSSDEELEDSPGKPSAKTPAKSSSKEAGTVEVVDAAQAHKPEQAPKHPPAPQPRQLPKSGFKRRNVEMPPAARKAAPAVGQAKAKGAGASKGPRGAPKEEPRSQEGAQGVPAVEVAWHRQLSWGSLIPEVWKQQGCEIPSLENRAMTLEQLSYLNNLKDKVFEKHTKQGDFGFDIRGPAAKLNEVMRHVVDPILAAMQCSWVELVASGKQPADFFVSNTTRLPLTDAIASLQAHSNARGAWNYWIRDFALRRGEADLAADGRSRVVDLLRVISSPSCRGSLLLLDMSKDAQPRACAFRSTWCLSELAASLEVEGKHDFLLDLGAFMHAGDVQFGDPKVEKESPLAYRDVPSSAILQLQKGDQYEWVRENEKASLASWLVREGLSFSWAAAVKSEEEEQVLSLEEQLRPDLEALQDHFRHRLASIVLYTLSGGRPVLYKPDLELLESLVRDAPEVVNEPMSFGETAVFRAAAWNCEDALRVLVQGRADVTLGRADGTTPIDVALAYKHKGIIKLLNARLKDCFQDKQSKDKKSAAAMTVKRQATQILALQDDIAWSPVVNWNNIYDGDLTEMMHRVPDSDVDKAEENGIHVWQLKELLGLVSEVFDAAAIYDRFSYRHPRIGSDFDPHRYHICDLLIKPLTKCTRSSWVKFIRDKPSGQMPSFFVSGWWGQPFKETVALLDAHQAARNLEHKAYWICTFANSQHDFILQRSLDTLPFYKVIRSSACLGTVALVDSELLVLKRIWSVYDLHVTIMQKSFYDLAYWNPDSDALVLDLENGCRLGSSLPTAGLDIHCRAAECSVEADRTFVLDRIRADYEPLEEEEAFGKLDRSIQRRFAADGLRSLINGHMTNLDLRRVHRISQTFPESCDEPNFLGETPTLFAFHYEQQAVINVLMQAAEETIELTLDPSSDKAGAGLFQMLLHSRKLKKLHLPRVQKLTLDTAWQLGRAISAMSDLQDLNLSGNKEAGPLIPSMLQHRKLRKLNLAHCDLPAAIIEQLARLIAAMGDLDELNLRSNKEVGPSLPIMLHGKSKMRLLDLADCGVTKEVSAELSLVIAAMSELQKLILSHSKEIEPYLPEILKDKNQLVLLDLEDCGLQKETCEKLGPHIAAMCHLQEVTLSGNHQVGPCLPVMLQGKPELLTLNVADCELSPELAEQMGPAISAMRKLRKLNLSSNEKIGSGLLVILKGTQKLEKLDLAGVDLNVDTGGGATPVILASQRGETAALEFLLEERADPNARMQNGATAAAMACQNGHADALRALLKARADPDVAADDGATPALIASQNGHALALQLLLEARVNLHKANGTGATPLFLAAQNRQTLIVNMLLQARADPNQVERCPSPAWIAAYGGDRSLGVLQLLLEHRADLGAAKYEGRSPLEVAKFLGAAKVVEELLKSSGAKRKKVLALKH